MKLRNKSTTPQIENAVSKSVNFEISIADIAQRSERRAWIVAFSAILMSLILAGGYFYMLPLKQKVPYLVMADAYTGTSTVARLKDDFNNQFITTSEAFNKSNVAHFVIARESYDIALMNLRDWTTVYSMSSPNVASGYTTLHSRTNPNSPYKTYGNSRAIRVKILSIVLIGGTAETAPKGATVRFQRVVYDKTNGSTRSLDSKLATLEFLYKSNLKMDEKDRIENPLGFQVTSYRVDSDYAASPPLETEVLPMPQMQVDALSGSPMPGAPLPAGSTVQDQAAVSATSVDGSMTSNVGMPVPTPVGNTDGASNQ